VGEWVGGDSIVVSIAVSNILSSVTFVKFVLEWVWLAVEWVGLIVKWVELEGAILKATDTSLL